MASKPTQVPTNSLSLLLGEYNSDSDNEDGKPSQIAPRTRSVQQITEAVDNFVSELDTICQPVGSTNWAKCMDKNTGHPYYWNMDTKDVTWEVPVEYQLYLDQNASLLADARVANMWTVCYADDSKTSTYYVNEFTRIVSWNKPIGFVEPTVVAPDVPPMPVEIESKPCKNIIKRRKTTKSKRDNPFSKKDEDIEKIELITSFDVKSDSSSDEERLKSKSSSSHKSVNLKLVATDYNSDDNACASPLPTSTVPSTALPPKNSKLTSEPLSLVPTRKSSKKINTFASIITGGRSPEPPSKIPLEAIPGVEEAVDVATTTTQQIVVAATPVKMAKRKRRIEFITTASETVDSPENEFPPQSNNVQVFKNSDSNGGEASEAVETVKRPTYSNFHAGGVEFDKKSSVTSDVVMVATSAASNECSLPVVNGAELPPINGAAAEATEKVATLKVTIEAKLKFLSDGRPEVPAVQAILIQLETLLEAHEEGALQGAYMLKWLEGIDTDLQTLEADAAPAGWKCLWNRSKSQYCYKHLDTGEIQWEYPGGIQDDDDSADGVECGNSNGGSSRTARPLAPSFDHRDDAMDICTTPPPNINEQLVLAAGATSKGKSTLQVLGEPADPPKWNKSTSILEPLPPGTDLIQLDHNLISTKCNSSTINMELASFYSDLAAIDSISTPAAAQTMSETAIVAGDSNPSAGIVTTTATNKDVATTAVDDDGVAKKKKRKIKKLQPWRSGNLETWISKWQKAQQELDN